MRLVFCHKYDRASWEKKSKNRFRCQHLESTGFECLNDSDYHQDWHVEVEEQPGPARTVLFVHATDLQGFDKRDIWDELSHLSAAIAQMWEQPTAVLAVTTVHGRGRFATFGSVPVYHWDCIDNLVALVRNGAEPSQETILVACEADAAIGAETLAAIAILCQGYLVARVALAGGGGDTGGDVRSALVKMGWLDDQTGTPRVQIDLKALEATRASLDAAKWWLEPLGAWDADMKTQAARTAKLIATVGQEWIQDLRYRGRGGDDPDWEAVKGLLTGARTGDPGSEVVAAAYLALIRRLGGA